MALKNLVFTLFFVSISVFAQSPASVRKKIINKLKRSRYYKPKMGHKKFKKYLPKLARVKKPTATEVKLFYKLGKIEAALGYQKNSKSLKNSALNNLYIPFKFKYKASESKSLMAKLVKKKKKRRVSKKKTQAPKPKTVFSPKLKKIMLTLSYTTWQEDKVVAGASKDFIIDSVYRAPTLGITYDFSRSTRKVFAFGLSLGKGKLDSIERESSQGFERMGSSSLHLGLGAMYLWRLNESVYLGPRLNLVYKTTDYELEAGDELKDPSLRTPVLGIRTEMRSKKFGFFTDFGYGMAMASPFIEFGLIYQL